MIDRLGREVDYLRLSLTSRCNLRCTYCLPAGYRPEEADLLSEDDFVFIVRAAASMGIRRVRLTGGEPLLADFLPGLISRISQIPEIEDIALTTNGLTLAHRAAELKALGLKRVNISIDSLKRDRYAEITRGGDLDDALAGVGAAMAAGLAPVKINCVVIGGINDDEIEAYAGLTVNSPLAVRFIELMPFGECSEWPQSRFVPLEDIKARLGLLEESHEVGGGPATVFRIPGALGTVGFIQGVSQHFCSTCNRLRVTSHGKIRPCLFADEELDLLPAIRSRSLALAREVICDALQHKPDRMAVQMLKRMAEIGG